MHHTTRDQVNTPTSPASAALSKPNVVLSVVGYLEVDLLLYGRERRQALLAELASTRKAWTRPVNQIVYRNPYFGTAERARQLYESLQNGNPERKDFIRKLIFGEGSSTDITNWPDPHLVPSILRLARNVEVVGVDGLHHVDLDDFRSALRSCTKLSELRACDKLPQPWCYVGAFFDDFLGPCKNVTRFRLYNLAKESEPTEGDPASSLKPQPFNRPLKEAAFNHCSIYYPQLKNILEASHGSLQSLFLENPKCLTDDDLVNLLERVGRGLVNLTVEGLSENMTKADFRKRSPIIERILRSCPNLEVLNFPDALGGPASLDELVESKLRLWAFTCTEDVRPEHWLEAFKKTGFPAHASCRIYVKGWTARDIRHVRIEAHKNGLIWLTTATTLTDLSEDSVE